MIIKDNMANMCAKVTSTYMEFTLAFGPKPEFSFSFKFNKINRTDLVVQGIPMSLRMRKLCQQWLPRRSVLVVGEGGDVV